MFAPNYYFDLSKYQHRDLFDGVEDVWMVFQLLEKYVRTKISLIPQAKRILGEVREGAKLYGEDIVIEEGALVESTAYIRGPVYIGKRSIVGPGAFIRGPVITGENCIIGNSTEAKGTILLDKSQASHFNYIGDSIIGNSAGLGAGAQLANTKINGRSVLVAGRDTGLERFGAILGDGTRLGCNVVCDPGTLIGKSCLVLPLTYIRAGCYERGEDKFMLKKNY